MTLILRLLKLRVNVRTEAQAVFRKKITLYRNFFRNLNFQNIVIFLRGHVQGRRQEKGTFDCIYRPTKEAKTKVYIFVYKIFTNNFLNSYTAILM